jgi:hypothetical protein
MKAKIDSIDWKKGMVSLTREDGGQSLFEILSDDNFEIEDEIMWEEHNPFGHCRIANLTQEEIAEVFFQNH